MNKTPIFRIDCDPPARLWGGVGWLDIPADSVEAAPARYLGGGALCAVPDLEQVLNNTAGRVDVVVSGVNALTQSLALEEAPSVQGAIANAGFAYFDDDQQLIEVEWVGTLKCDTLSPSNQQSQNGRTRSISLSLSTENTDRSRAPVAFWTHQDQQRLSPGDLFFDHVAGISGGTSRRFGPSD